ncbi:hypothetical protein CCMA1212_008134 [Trichoderma ghanense]|uniref:Uncharacterized protein n=1 Tax=Trichoderma ghanense TaxID=65468 RepID=A0ABY2GVR5_9HYPO
MLPDHLWPGLFFLALLFTIGIFACLIYTVVSILIQRHNAAREESPDEVYRTFERSFRRGENDDDGIGPARRNTGSLVVPNRFVNREGLRGDGRLRRHRETFDERRVSRTPTAAQRALMGLQGERVGGPAPRGIRSPARGRDRKNPARYAYAGAEETMFDMSV